MPKTYLVKSNHSVSDVRKIHDSMPKKLGIDVESICEFYGEDYIEEETMEDFRKLGYKFRDRSGKEKYYLDPDEMVNLWFFLLRKTEPELKMELLENDLQNLNHPDGDFSTIDVGYGLYTIDY